MGEGGREEAQSPVLRSLCYLVETIVLFFRGQGVVLTIALGKGKGEKHIYFSICI